MRRFLIAVVACCVAVAVLVGVGYAQGNILGFRFWSWNQKLTVSVQTPQGMKTASAVTEAFWDMPPEWFRLGDSGGHHGGGKLTGEAVVLELDPGKYLFVLLQGYSPDTAIWTFAEPPLKSDYRREYGPALDRLSEVSEARELSRDRYPLFVTFDDMSDPASVRKVDPGNLAATFGPGYALTSITVAITDEPVTRGRVEEVLGWLEEVGRRRPTLIPNPPRLLKDASDPDIQNLTPGPFSTELYK